MPSAPRADPDDTALQLLPVVKDLARRGVLHDALRTRYNELLSEQCRAPPAPGRGTPIGGKPPKDGLLRGYSRWHLPHGVAE